MIHKPIQIKDIDLSFAHKTCFDNFNCNIQYGNRIGIIGKNGSGKSSLLKMIAGILECNNDHIHREDLIIGYVPQIIQEYNDLSGGERVNRALTESLSFNPNLLLLDEPTNHLDLHNRKSLIRMLQNYQGTLIIISHDRELLSNCVNIVWHIDNGKIQVFSGNYGDYINEIKIKRASIEAELTLLNRQKKDMHYKLMQEQQRAAKSKARGKKKVENRKWTKMLGGLNEMKAEKSQGKKLKAIESIKNDLGSKLSDMRISEIIAPKFSITSSDVNEKTIIQISDGSIGYFDHKPILSRINLKISGSQRIAITGANGTGKSSLIKAILGDEVVYKRGDWYVVKSDNIGYLDQHYSNLDLNNSVFKAIQGLVPNWSYVEIRRHLNEFLFRKNEEVENFVSALSGGEKARLSLAQIAAKTPKLLILDEISNNLDLETQEHVSQVLRFYPGAIVVISHDADFLDNIKVEELIDIGSFK